MREGCITQHASLLTCVKAVSTNSKYHADELTFLTCAGQREVVYQVVQVCFNTIMILILLPDGSRLPLRAAMQSDVLIVMQGLQYG